MIELLESTFSIFGNMMPAFSLLGEAVAHGEVADAVAAPSNESLFSIAGIFTLGMLILLQVVLGFDNLLYISIESKRVPEESQSKVRKLGIGLAIVFRIILLFVVIKLIALLQDAFVNIDTRFVKASISGHSLIVIFGGGFILYTAVKEIYHLLSVPGIDHEGESGGGSSVGKAVAMIVVMNLVFSFDSILSAMALTENLAIMATAIIFSGLMMIWLADHVAEFLKKNRMYEVLGLFVLFIVGVMLVSEGGHLAELQFFGHPVHAMSKSTFYFVLAVLIVVDVVQARFQKNLLAQQAAKEKKLVA
ncbi:MAG: TerC family protein [Pirellulaceae bacterium]